MIPTIRIKSEPSDDNQSGFIVINLSDFVAGVHEASDPADLDNLTAAQPRVLTTDDVNAARAELERMHTEIVAERQRLDAQAAEQEAERQRLAEANAKLAADQAADSTGMTAAELKAELTKRGIEFAGNASKAVLQGLLDAAHAV